VTPWSRDGDESALELLWPVHGVLVEDRRFGAAVTFVLRVPEDEVEPSGCRHRPHAWAGHVR